MVFSVITKNSSLENWTKNLVKDKMALRMKNFNILEVHWKIRFLRGGGSRKINIYWGIATKGGLEQFADLRGGAWQNTCLSVFRGQYLYSKGLESKSN